MELGRCVRLLAPLAILTAVTAASPLAPPGLAGAGAVRVPSGTCGSLGAGSGAGAAGSASVSAWYRLDPRLDTGGTLWAMRLEAGFASGPRWAVDLPAESFASGPEGGLVLVGDDDGVRSRLRLLDPARGCWTAVGVEGAVVRSAVLRAETAVIWEHRVDRASRVDLGIWRRSLATGRSERVLEPMAGDPVYGRTFTTELTTAPDGHLLAASCGLKACRTRVLDTVTGGVDVVLGTGPAVGLAGERLLAMEICPALPCSVTAVDLRTGARTRVADGVMAAGLGGSTLVWSDAGGSVWQTELAVAGAAPERMDGAVGLVPLRRSSLSSSGASVAGGGLVLAPAGRVSNPGLLRVLGEVLP